MINSRSRPIVSWNQPKLDLGGCVLYLPLWRPDMVARGGSIRNGTGILDASPQNLAVGVNTLTATGAGTFLISVPYTATCASGTATITGSPVTLNPGLNSVTTGVTTGNFTVTTSNIIRSRDSIGHLATVTGATWGSQGRTFNGTSDKITIPFHSSFNIATELTILYWVKADVLIGNRIDIQLGDLSGSWNMLMGVANQHFSIYDGTWEQYGSGYTYLVDTWYLVGFTYDVNKLGSFYVNGAFQRSDTWTKTLPTIDNDLTIGHETDANFGNTWYDGTFGEVILYNRALTAAEIQRNYQVTKWRYQ